MTWWKFSTQVDPDFAAIVDAALEKRDLRVEQAERLLTARDAEFHLLLAAADAARKEDCGDDVSYVVNRNINWTNVCYRGCSFCGFSRYKHEAEAYEISLEQIVAKASEAVARGATEVCIQGGIHPNRTHETYLAILSAIKKAHPSLHIHAFSPEEIDFSQQKSGMPLREYLLLLKASGLGSIPGTGAEVLDDALRETLAPRKLGTQRWIEIVRAAHEVGLPSSSTLLYGHIETPAHVARHLEILRTLQKETGGFTEFVPLGFIHTNTKLFQEFGARPGSSMLEDLRLLATARLFLRPWIRNVQVSWVKMGPKLAQMGLLAGANDFGGTLMEESISKLAGAGHGECLEPHEIRTYIREVGRMPVERNTLYRILRRFEETETKVAAADSVAEGFPQQSNSEKSHVAESAEAKTLASAFPIANAVELLG